MSDGVAGLGGAIAQIPRQGQVLVVNICHGSVEAGRFLGQRLGRKVDGDDLRHRVAEVRPHGLVGVHHQRGRRLGTLKRTGPAVEDVALGRECVDGDDRFLNKGVACRRDTDHASVHLRQIKTVPLRLTGGQGEAGRRLLFPVGNRDGDDGRPGVVLVGDNVQVSLALFSDHEAHSVLCNHIVVTARHAERQGGTRIRVTGIDYDRADLPDVHALLVGDGSDHGRLGVVYNFKHVGLGDLLFAVGQLHDDLVVANIRCRWRACELAGAIAVVGELDPVRLLQHGQVQQLPAAGCDAFNLALERLVLKPEQVELSREPERLAIHRHLDADIFGDGLAG